MDLLEVQIGLKQVSSNTNISFETAPSKVVPFGDVLWLQKQGDDEADLVIDYVDRHSSALKLSRLNVHVEDTSALIQNNYDKYILDHAYPLTKIYTRKLLVLINPHGGQGRAVEYFNTHCRPILDKAHVQYEFVTTDYYRHATDIARELDISKYDCIVCASGDGIPHEVINGLYEREDRVELFNKLALAQLPCGSGNALSFSCLGTADPKELTLRFLKSDLVKTDAMAVTQGTGSKKNTKLSFLTQTYGVIADSDIGTEWLRWMGPARFDLGVLIKTFQKAKYPCQIYVKYLAKDKDLVSNHYDYHSNLSPKDHQVTKESFQLKYPDLDHEVPEDWDRIDPQLSKHLAIFYVGKMPFISKDVNFFPLALPNDGSLDLVITDARTNVMKTAHSLLSLDKGSHVLHEEVQHSKILAYRLVPQVHKSYISVDGESFPFEPMQVEVIPGLLQVYMINGQYKDTGFNR